MTKVKKKQSRSNGRPEPSRKPESLHEEFGSAGSVLVESAQPSAHLHKGLSSNSGVVTGAGIASVIANFFGKNEPAERFLVLAGDAYDLLDHLPPKSVDLFITSPPYWGLRTYGLSHNWDIASEWKQAGNGIEQCPPYTWYPAHGGLLGLEPTPEWYVQHLVEIVKKFWRPLKVSGSVWLNMGDTYFARWASIRPEGRQGLGSQTRFRRKTPMGGFRQEKNLLLIPARIAIELQHARWILRNDLHLVQTECPTPSRRRPTPAGARAFLPLREASV